LYDNSASTPPVQDRQSRIIGRQESLTALRDIPLDAQPIPAIPKNLSAKYDNAVHG
jgi:hypothetical protein